MPNQFNYAESEQRKRDQIELAYAQKDGKVESRGAVGQTPPEFGRKPIWRVMDSSGKKPDTLIHCFIQRTILDLSNGVPDSLTAMNGTVYFTIYDSFNIPEDHTKIAVIISYQSHSYGNFAIVRNYNPSMGKKA